MGADHGRRAGVDQVVGHFPLPIARPGPDFRAPMQEGYDNIGMLLLPCGANVGQHLAFIEPGDARPILAGGERARREAVVAQQGDPQAVALHNQRPPCFLLVRPPPNQNSPASENIVNCRLKASGPKSPV